MAGKIFDLPALVGTDLLALNAAAGTGALFGAQFVYMGGDGKIFEVGQIPPALAPFHPPQFFLRFRMRRNIVRVDRLAIQFLGEAQQQLRQIAWRSEAGLRAARSTASCSHPALPAHAAVFEMQIVALAVEALPLCVSAPGRVASHPRVPPAAIAPWLQAFVIIGKLNIQRGTLKL